tara:strand:+ start:18547 stop:18708 length:162 start_codon:yes stop_codon:yes gene_type:complete
MAFIKEAVLLLIDEASGLQLILSGISAKRTPKIPEIITLLSKLIESHRYSRNK